MASKVLIVDDSMMIRRQVTRVLGDAGFEVIEAVDGLDGLAKILEGGQSLVVCDINMPRMSGLELLEELGPSVVSALPVVMLSTDGAPELVQRAKSLGAKGWIIKPLQASLLVTVAKRLALS